MVRGEEGSRNGSDGKMKGEWSEKSRVLHSSSIPCLGFFLFIMSQSSLVERAKVKKLIFFCHQLPGHLGKTIAALLDLFSSFIKWDQ